MTVAVIGRYAPAVGRWEPNARARLEQAGLELYGERGFENTTVAEIAKRAGLTERTFFRHFTDKREVLFAGSGGLREVLVDKVDEAPPTSTPIEVVVGALGEVATMFFEERRPLARRRQAVIAANEELLERELVKLAALATALAEALRRRGVAEPAASLAAEAGIAVFKVAFGRWVVATGGPTLSELVRRFADELGVITAEPTSARR